MPGRQLTDGVKSPLASAARYRQRSPYSAHAQVAGLCGVADLIQLHGSAGQAEGETGKL